MKETARVRSIVPLVVGQLDLNRVERRSKVDVGRLRMHKKLLDEVAERQDLRMKRGLGVEGVRETGERGKESGLGKGE